MTPADELRAAATRLRALGRDAAAWDELTADWLDEVAWRADNRPKQYRAARHALAVARAVLGEPAEVE